MSYTLYHSDGKLFLTLADQQTNKIDTSLTLIGKNVTGYGADINQNYIKLLENFANSVAPTSPQVGQMWYDTISQQIKVCTVTGSFKPVGNPTISATKPLTLSMGDLWYDTTNEQLKFQSDASTEPIVIGPLYSAISGKSGWVTETYSNSTGSSQTVVVLYANDTVMGVLSPYTFNVTGSTYIYQGFNAIYNDSVQTKFYGTATYAESISGIEASQLITDSDTVYFTHDVQIAATNTDVHLVIGTDQDFQFVASTGTFRSTATMLIGGTDQNFELTVSSALFPTKGPAIFVDGTNNKVGFYETSPQYDVDVNGDVRVKGNLIVSGTTVLSDKIRSIDKNFVLNVNTSNTTESVPDGSLPAADVAHGGGFKILDKAAQPLSNPHGAPEITWITSRAAGVDGSVFGTDASWSFTDNVELRFADSAYYIFNQRVMHLENGDTVVTDAVRAPNLIEIGNLTGANIAEIRFTTTSSWVNTSYPYASIIGSDRNNAVLVIGNNLTSYIDCNSNIVRSVETPASEVEAGVTEAEFNKMAANVEFVKTYTDLMRNPILSTTIDCTGVVTDSSPVLNHPQIDTFVIQMLTYLYNPSPSEESIYRAPPNARARVICMRYATPGIGNPDTGVGGVASEYIDMGLPLDVDQNNVPSAAQAVEWSTGIRAYTIFPPFPMNVYRGIKEYVVSGGVWVPSNSGSNIIWAGNFNDA